MKKILALVLALVLALSLAACSGGAGYQIGIPADVTERHFIVRIAYPWHNRTWASLR